jgi:hypothetical protein
VERVADITESFGRRLADPLRARELLGLPVSAARTASHPALKAVG